MAIGPAVAFVVGFAPWIVFWVLVGTALVYGVFVIMTLTLSDNFLERWLQPLGNAGLCASILVSILIGKPFRLQ